ncbi:MAG: hypothetical protein KUG78_12080 [Kangiellaceae bacterium]|nr:hypothetical protein [Kangiellaceae bacterium]
MYSPQLVAELAIVDFDVHHDNRTQEVFEKDGRVLYISTHQWPFWPGTGRAEDIGVGNLLNIPLLAGMEGMTYRKTFAEQAIPTLHKHKPQLILASAGFDGHRDDPLADLKLVEQDYQWIGGQLVQIADQHCDGKVISFLEGGNNLKALAASTVSYLKPFI